MADQTVRAVLTDNRTLSGTFTTSDGVALAVGDRVLAQNQTSPLGNLIYTVAAGAWTQDAISYTLGMDVRVLEGTEYGMSRFTLTSLGTITPGATAMVWKLESKVPMRSAGEGLQEADNSYRLPIRSTEGDPDWIAAPAGRLVFTEEGVLKENLLLSESLEHLVGFKLVRVSSSSLQVWPGTATIPDTLETCDLAPGYAFPGFSPALSANTLYYLYLYPASDTLATGAVEYSTTAPTTYSSMADMSVKTGDDSRRYIGCFRTDGSGNIYNFQVVKGTSKYPFVSYLEDTTTSPFRVVSGGTATTNQTVNLGPSGLKLVPPTCRMIYGRIAVNATAGVWLDNSEMSTNPAAATGYRVVTPSERAQHFWIPLDSNQSFRWANTAAGGATNIDVQQYVDRR